MLYERENLGFLKLTVIQLTFKLSINFFRTFIIYSSQKIWKRMHLNIVE